MSAPDREIFFRAMFEVQASYLHHRLGREPWWGMDYALGNFSTIKSICKNTPGVRLDLDEIPYRERLAAAWDAFETNRDPAGREAFVAFLWRQWSTRWLIGYPVLEKHLAEETYIGCFRYDWNEATQAVHLHFNNQEAPNSPLTDLDRRREDLRALIREIELKRYTPKTVHFESWMNGLTPVLELFPRAFAQSLKAAEEFPKGYGWWGQFITKDGQINPKRAAAFKQTGKFEFKRLNGQCTWNEFRMKTLNASDDR